MLKLAAEKYPHPKIHHKQLDIIGDVDKFVRAEGQFQRVYSFLMLQWVRDQRRAMANVEKLLLPGGECLLMFERNLHFFDLFVAMMNSPRWAKYAHVSGPCHLRLLPGALYFVVLVAVYWPIECIG
ncbi:hypothetical protein HPB48_026442 [Haemaphysalis longicornis]|uniref:Methyltransferase type 11 domain-containing protein n=1 Tax=Haemaphysalis longicornis TaxID=44386 RepID=A0A9J6H9R9_HAELO|nr:hypothetical protein HPB48_026442 [Haemaphysalis longicornis]